jgi:hypothetical protein
MARSSPGGLWGREMTTYAISSPTNDTGDVLRWDRVARVQHLCARYLGREPVVTDDGTTLSVVFTPDLTAAQVTMLGRLVKISGFGVITPDELAAVEASITTAKSYVNITNPTTTQTANALKAAIRVIGVILRD